MQISAHIICIGNEIMLGDITNSNAKYISNNLTHIGIETTRVISIPDDNRTIIDCIRASLYEAPIVVVTGGLGPTVDDLTLESISEALNKKLIFRQKVANHIKEHFKKRHLKMPPNNLRQALIPEGAIPILNDIGTAPGLLIPINKKVLIALPGVPFELYPMIERTVLDYLKKSFCPDRIIKSRVIKITGLPESKVNEKIADILKLRDNVRMGIYPHPEEVTVKITASGQTKKKVAILIKKIEKKIQSRLDKYIFGYDNELLEGIVGRLLLNAKKTLSIAESCTGGLLSNRITNIPKSSLYFKLGVTVYSNISKNRVLDIPMKMIERYGAVSKQIATLMAKNVRLVGETDIGIGISGIAGPGGATKKKPVGLVYIALASREKTICNQFHFLGQREIIKYKASQSALDMIRKIFI